MKRNREKGSSPSEHLRNIDRHLEGEADRWAKNTPSVRTSILKGYGDEATDSDVEAFHEAIIQRFKLTKEETWAIRNKGPLYDLSSLHQEVDRTPSENLERYYSRARDILIALHGRDDDYDTLTPPEISLRRIVIAQFVRNLRDDWPASKGYLQTRLYQQQVLDYRVSLHKVFMMAETESKRLDLERARWQKGKRKLATDEEESDNPKKQKEMIVKIRLPTPTQHDEVSSESHTSGELSPETSPA